MASLVVSGDTSGAITLSAPAVAGTNTLTIPASTGTLITTASSGQSIPKAALPTGSVLQVVSATKSDTQSVATTTFTDLTGLSVSITPTSASSKILVLFDGNITNSDSTSSATSVRLVRGSTAIAVGDSAGSRALASSSMFTPSATVANRIWNAASMNFLDSPNTTSATTYKVQMAATSTGYINRTHEDTDEFRFARTASTITVMEIAA